MSNFWQSLGLLLVNPEVELDLSCSRYCVVSEISRTTAVGGNLPVEATKTTTTISEMNNAKLFVPIPTLSTNDNIKFLRNIKQGF